jgi:hypothetical protein
MSDLITEDWLKSVGTGLCECGCGRQTRIATKTDRRAGQFKDVPLRFVCGHSSVKPRPSSRVMVIDGFMCRTIPLTLGMEAIVDIADYDRLSMWRWGAERAANTYYASRNVRHDGVQSKRRMQHDVLGTVGAGVLLDHKNRNGLDNRRTNLRSATVSQNLYNRILCRNNKCGLKGVYLSKRHNRWAAEIRVDKRKICLGLFMTKEEAAHAYDAAAVIHHGEFAVVNFTKSDHSA